MKIKNLAFAITMIGVSAGAQVLAADANETQKIEVTGSNIKRVSKETSSPVTVVTRKEIEQSGKATVAEVLRAVSANTGGSYNEVFSNSFSPGASGVSLRGLGQKATLVLLNGRRAANYGFAQNLQDSYFDLNSLPASAIERVEILKDGASAVYGSDAIAGVVNIILRKNYQGAEVSAGYGISSENDMGETHVAVTGGIGDLAKDRYNVLASFDYFQRDGITLADRDSTKDQDFSNQPGGLFGWATSAGTYRRGTDRQAFAKCIGPGAVMDATVFGLTGTACAWNPASFLSVMPETKRANGFIRGTFDFAENLQGYAEAFLSSTETKQTFTPAGITNSGIHYNPATGGVTVEDYRLPVGNPSNPDAAPVAIGYTFFDVGPRSAKIKSDSYRALAGLKGDIGTWNWDAAASTSKNKAHQDNYNRVNAVVLKQMITDGSYNFANPAANTNGQADKLRLTVVRESESKLDTFDGKISGELLELPAGMLGAAFGVDYRKETLADRPDANLTQGLVLGQGATATTGSRNVKALFFELNAPIVKNLELNLAGRGDDYSDFGSAFSPALGLKWTPIKEVLFRASAGKGFRAPTLAENSQSSATFFTTVTDRFHPVPSQRNRSFSIAGVYTGNPDLKAEHSRNFNLGIVIEPSANFNASLDLYKIRQKDLVSSDSFQFIENNENNPAYSKFIVRDPVTQNISFITSGYKNLAYVETKGLDLNLTYRSKATQFGRFTTALDATYLISYKVPPALGEEAVEYAGNNGYGALPRTKGSLTLGWDKNEWTTKVKLNYTSGWQQQSADGQDRVAGQVTTDVYANYDVTKQLGLSFSVLNAFNRTPPYDASDASNGFDFTQYDLRGRYYRLTANYKF
ncbi:TonB-dependent receptor [Chitinimonas naiadis]